MADPLAPKAAAAQALVVQESPKVLDNTMPIMIGNQRIGGVRVGMALDEPSSGLAAADAGPAGGDRRSGDPVRAADPGRADP
ncbi:hypothetical protein G6F66_015541 [Rhizopus arrhizus]|nr:hypothetical protein G6F24_017756 [Rhizopus arrhizus]KAG1247618.1 hypothetical protein G6F66_015541 [Rhizopus arrhizus]